MKETGCRLLNGVSSKILGDGKDDNDYYQTMASGVAAPRRALSAGTIDAS